MQFVDPKTSLFVGYFDRNAVLNWRSMVGILSRPAPRAPHRARKCVKTESKPECVPYAGTTGPYATGAGRSSPLLRLAQVIERVGLKKTTIYALQRARKFPHSVPLTETAVGWVESEVEEWLAAKLVSRDAKLQGVRTTR